MKRIFALALAVTLLLCGCGKSTDNNDKGGNAATVKLGDVSLTVGAAFTAQQKDALGEPVSTEEAPSCHFDGMDTVYTYTGYSLQTYRQDDADILCVITIEDAAYPTDKGIKVGDTATAVTEAYGEAAEQTKYYVVYDLTEEVSLTFQLKDDAVTTILYELKA